MIFENQCAYDLQKYCFAVRVVDIRHSLQGIDCKNRFDSFFWKVKKLLPFLMIVRVNHVNTNFNLLSYCHYIIQKWACSV